MKAFKRAKVTYVTPIPQDLIDWNASDVRAAFREWSRIVAEIPAVQNYLASGPTEAARARWWDDTVLRACDHLKSEAALAWLRRRIATAELQITQLTALVVDMKAQLGDMERIHAERYGD